MARKTFEQLKRAIRASGVPTWQIESDLGMPRSNLSRILTFDPKATASQERTDEIMSVIKQREK